VFVNLNAGGAIVQTDNGPVRGFGMVSPLHGDQPVIDDVRVLAPPPDAPPGEAYFEVGLYQYRPGNR